MFSQDGEDGVIEKIFELIEPASPGFAVEFGASDGVRASNVRNLILNKGWGAFLIEGDPARAAELIKNYADVPNVTTLEHWVWPGNIEILFEENGVPPNFDFMVIDIDSNDYYVWRVMHEFRPKVVMIEINGLFPPPQKMVVEFHPMNYWDRTAYAGASLQSLYELGKRKGYELVYLTQNGINAFFVEEKYFDRFGIADNSPATLYRPPPKVFQKLLDPLIPPNRKYLTWDNLKIEKKFRYDR